MGHHGQLVPASLRRPFQEKAPLTGEAAAQPLARLLRALVPGPHHVGASGGAGTLPGVLGTQLPFQEGAGAWGLPKR